MANTITITGALGRAPALNFTQNGKAAWGFSLAYTPSRKNDQTNQWEDTGPTLWFDVTAWGHDAETLAERYAGIEKGRATVTGRLGSRTWTNRDGIEQTQMTITADAIQIHPAQGQNQQQGGSWSGQQQQSGYSQGGWNNQPQQQSYQPGPGGPAQQADPEPARQPWQQQPITDEPPF